MLPAVIAILMFILTMLFFVALLRLTARRRRIKEDASNDKKKPSKENTGKASVPSGPWGVPKGSYCYPGINDTMGYEFVRVVPVDESIRPKGILTEVPAEHEDDDLQVRVSTVGENAASISENTGNVIDAVPGQEEQERELNEGIPSGYPGGPAEETIDIEAADYGLLSAAWQSREHDKPDYDEELNRILDENPDFISDEEPTDDELSVAEQISDLDNNYLQLREALSQSLDSDPSQETGRILERLQELDRANSKGLATVTTDDLPQID